MIWGGDRLRNEYGYHIPSDHTGECWAVSAHPNGDCSVESGKFAGCFLSDLWKNHRELFGNLQFDRFPLLTKIIDAKEDLSIQVHPDDAYAFVHENGSLGKTECWYILDCDPDAQIVTGHHAKSKEELKSMINNKEWDQLIRTVDVKKGDFFQINPGCIHAIKGGCLILETQQNSDITYRVYDYDRLSSGKPRELHIEKSMDVITAPFNAASYVPEIEKGEGYQKTHYIACQYYAVDKVDISGTAIFRQEKPFLIISVIEGMGTIDGHKIVKGQHFILPYQYGDFAVKGNLRLICSSVY